MGGIKFRRCVNVQNTKKNEQILNFYSIYKLASELFQKEVKCKGNCGHGILGGNLPQKQRNPGEERNTYFYLMERRLREIKKKEEKTGLKAAPSVSCDRGRAPEGAGPMAVRPASGQNDAHDGLHDVLVHLLGGLQRLEEVLQQYP